MKKSNKLLLGALATIMLMITGVHIALYAKYKKGDHTLYMPGQDLQTFNDIKYVSIRDVDNMLVTFGDTAQTSKDNPDELLFDQKGDTLVITGKLQVEPPGYRPDVRITLPYNATVSLTNSVLLLEPGLNTKENNPVFHLQQSQIFFQGIKNKLSLGRVRITATDSSAAIFQGNTHVDTLDVQLSGSSIDYMDGNFGQLSILTDSISRISLQTKHLLRANIRTTTQ